MRHLSRLFKFLYSEPFIVHAVVTPPLRPLHPTHPTTHTHPSFYIHPTPTFPTPWSTHARRLARKTRGTRKTQGIDPTMRCVFLGGWWVHLAPRGSTSYLGGCQRRNGWGRRRPATCWVDVTLCHTCATAGGEHDIPAESLSSAAPHSSRAEGPSLGWVQTSLVKGRLNLALEFPSV